MVANSVAAMDSLVANSVAAMDSLVANSVAARKKNLVDVFFEFSSGGCFQRFLGTFSQRFRAPFFYRFLNVLLEFSGFLYCFPSCPETFFYRFL